MKNGSWCVYIIQTERGHLYTGITTDLERRFTEHATNKKGAKYFRSTVPVEVLFTKLFPDRSAASKFEARVKAMTRAQKLKLIAGD
jgi:putative endonuclease